MRFFSLYLGQFRRERRRAALDAVCRVQREIARRGVMSFADILRENRGNIEFSAGPGLAVAETVIERLVEKLFVLSNRGEIHVPQNNHPSFSDRGIRFYPWRHRTRPKATTLRA